MHTVIGLVHALMSFIIIKTKLLQSEMYAVRK